MGATCIVVLGGGHSADGRSLDPRTIERVTRGAALYHGLVNESGADSTNGAIAVPENPTEPPLVGDVIFVCSGAWALTRLVPPPRTEAALMADLAVELGVPREAIAIEERSVDTIGNLAVVGTAILPGLEVDDVVVISSDFHMRRVRYLVGRVWGDRWRVSFVGAPSDIPVSVRLRLALRELRLLFLMHRLLRGIPRGDIAGCFRTRPLRDESSPV